MISESAGSPSRGAMAAMIALALVAAPASAALAKTVQIWFTPLTWNIKPSGGGLEYTEHDFPALVASDAGWQNAASHVSVITLPGNVVESYPDLPSLVAFSHRHTWRFGLGVGVEFSGGKCPQRLEGISRDTDANREAIRIARLWRNAGGTLDYIVMDSPLFFTHYANPQCQFSITDAADRAAATMRGILAQFPTVSIVDAEGPGAIPNDVWLADMLTWFQAFRQAVGRPIDRVSLDLHWKDLRPGSTWQNTARRAVVTFHGVGVATGLIIDASAVAATTRQSWMTDNRIHIEQAVRANLGLDSLHINQWQKQVEFNLPETDPSAYTSLVDDAYNALKSSALN